MTPFVLRGRKRLLPESAPKAQHVYDTDLQLWIDTEKNLPLVACLCTGAGPTQFGETTLTETREGADRTEGISVGASCFDETIPTRTREGLDQTESSPIQASQFGETILTKTSEGTDQSEVSKLAEFDASYSHF